MILTVCNDFARYRIVCPDHAKVTMDNDTDYLIVADPNDRKTILWLFDDILLAAATCGDCGLRLLSLEPIN
jgi:hypothetical protein